MSAARWDRLKDSLADAGITVTVDTRAYPGGVSRGITFRSGRNVIGVGDTWWRKNMDVWTGWTVYVEGPDSIVIRDWTHMKKCSEVVAAVRQALAVK